MTNTRKEALTALGAKIDEGVYVFYYSDKLFISEYQLTYLTDLEFNDFLEDVKTAFAKEQTRIFEERLSPKVGDIYENLPFINNNGKKEFFTGQVVSIKPTKNTTGNVSPPSDSPELKAKISASQEFMATLKLNGGSIVYPETEIGLAENGYVSGIDSYAPKDYSLNDFENLTKAAYNGNKKDKKTILDAIADYKLALDNF